MNTIEQQADGHPMEKRTVRVFVRGRVQGVGFRYWTVRTAVGLGLSGWVRNRFDRSVEALFHGAATPVEMMLKACESGPPGARVDGVHIEDAAAPAPDRPGFEQRETA